MLTLGRTIGELHVLMAILIDQPKLWPYEFLYSACPLRGLLVSQANPARTVEVELPPDSWTKVQLGAWLALQALSILVMHATHIQFLTMLFPSALEARLILGLLGASSRAAPRRAPPLWDLPLTSLLCAPQARSRSSRPFSPSRTCRQCPPSAT